MTAVEWLIEQIIKYELVPEGTNPDNVLFNKAKEMEHKQLEKAIEYGYELRNNNKPINSGIDWVKEFNSLEEATLKLYPDDWDRNERLAFIEGANWQTERMYSEEDLLSAFEAGMMFIGEDKGCFREWFEQFKKK